MATTVDKSIITESSIIGSVLFVGGSDGNATDRNALAVLIYEYAGDVQENAEGLPDGTIPRVTSAE